MIAPTITVKSAEYSRKSLGSSDAFDAIMAAEVSASPTCAQRAASQDFLTQEQTPHRFKIPAKKSAIMAHQRVAEDLARRGLLLVLGAATAAALLLVQQQRPAVVRGDHPGHLHPPPPLMMRRARHSLATAPH
jgi:hypothetical protein